MQIFSMDNAFFRFMGRLTDLVWLNILTLICCLPVFTAGAAISAMYRVLIRVEMGEEGTVTKPFFTAFKDNFKQATLVWVPCILIFLIMGYNLWLMSQGVLDFDRRLFIAAGVSIGIIIVAIMMFLNYYLSIISRYENPLKQNAKNAGLLMLAFFPRSICIVVIWLFPIALMLLTDYFLFFWFLYGLSFPGFFNSKILARVFKKMEGDKE